jgi:CheY-like chemotaxis protein
MLPLMIIHRDAEDNNRVHPRVSNITSSIKISQRLDGISVLVVDDEADTRELLEVILEQCGATVMTAQSAQAAIELLGQHHADVMLSDIGMPDEDGYELIRQVRALPPESGGRTPAIALTAYARVEDRLHALRAGYQMHVPKPVVLAELVALIASLVERSR